MSISATPPAGSRESHPPALVTRLERLGLSDMLDGFVPRRRVGVYFLEVEELVRHYGYRIVRERPGDPYASPLRVLPIPDTTPHTVRLHLAQRQDIVCSPLSEVKR